MLRLKWVKHNLYEQLNWKILFKKMIVQTLKIPDAQIWNIENKHLNVFQKIILITNFTNTTHLTLNNVLQNYDHYFRKGSGNSYSKLLISANPFIPTKFSTVELIQHARMFNISKYIDSKGNYSSKLF